MMLSQRLLFKNVLAAFFVILVSSAASAEKTQPDDHSFTPVSIAPELLERFSGGEFGFMKFIVVQRYPVNSSHVYTYHQEGLKPGGGLWVVDVASGKVERKKILDSPHGEILDANFHYDGRTILFSWKKTMADYFQLYTVDIDGSGLTQLTGHPSNNFNACFLPDGGILFLSDRKPAFAYCWKTTTPILWRCNIDGSDPIRISANYLNDFTPAVMENGKIIFSRWEYVDRPAIPIQSLWTINPDGTMLSGLFGNRSLSPATFMDAREIPGSKGKILCVLTSHNGPCRGAIGIIDPAIGGNAQEAIVNLTPEINIGRVDAGDGNRMRGPYLNPYPVNENYYLVSKEGTVQLRDYDGDFCQTLINARGDGGFYNPQPVRARKRERLVASSVDPGPKSDDEFKYSKYTSWISTHNGQEGNILEIAPGRWGAKASLLAKVIDSGHPDKDGQRRIDLSHSEKARIYAWLDLNCPYYGTSDSNYMKLRGCRRQLPEDFTGMIKEIASRRCMSCHENSDKDDNWVFKLKDNFYIRIDHPQCNNFLKSPLSKSAGGTQKCGQVVFRDTNDPDYRKIMIAFEKLQQKLQQRPRFDMLKLKDQKPRYSKEYVNN